MTHAYPSGRLTLSGNGSGNDEPMKRLLDEMRRLSDAIGRPVRLMEVCGTHTVAIFRHGIREVIPEEISLLSGPGCPVCVTPIGDVDSAIAIAGMDGVTLTTFGDMMRVPGGERSLDDAKADVHGARAPEKAGAAGTGARGISGPPSRP